MEFVTNPTIIFYLLLTLIILNLALSFWLWRVTRHYNSLIKSATKKTLSGILESIQKTLSIHEKNISSTKKDVLNIKQDNKSHLQQLKLKRYNPFSDTGGDQSFMLGILDGKNNGIIITSLHSRENTRFYVKSVLDGKGSDHSLSKDEQQLINKRVRK